MAQVKTEESRVAALEKLLADARAEADALRAKVKRYEDIIVSTRLIMGHELKKPATAITGYLDLVTEDLEGRGEPGALRFVEKAAEECALLNDLNDYFIELLKAGGGEEAVARAAVDVTALIRDVVSWFGRGEAADRRIVLGPDLEDPIVNVDGDALRLVLINLVENALRYSRVRTPVRVEAERAADRRGGADRALLKIRVIDEGIGIPQKYVRKVFEPFVRLHREVADGSGLGLTLVKSLVELGGGEVSIQSGAGMGTTVHVTLPIGTGEDEDPVFSL